MSGMYEKHARDGDVIYRLPPVDPPSLESFRTGPPSKIQYHGTSKDHFLGYVAEFTVGDKYSRVAESALQRALAHASVLPEVEILEVPVTGGKPRQDSVKLGFNDISFALSRINDSLPRRQSEFSSPSGMD